MRRSLRCPAMQAVAGRSSAGAPSRARCDACATQSRRSPAVAGRGLSGVLVAGLLVAGVSFASLSAQAATPVAGCAVPGTAPIIPAPTSVSPPAGLAPYVSPAGDFTVMIPSPVAVEEVPAPAGTTVTSYSSGSYGVAHVGAPEGGVSDLAGYIDEMLGGAGATLISCIAYAQQGFTGVELSAVFDVSPELVLFSRILDVGGDIYQIYGVGMSGQDHAELAAFFASFELVVGGVAATTVPGVAPVPTVVATTIPVATTVAETTFPAAPTVVSPTLVLSLPALPGLPGTVVPGPGVSAPPTVVAAPTSVSGAATVITPAAPPAGWVTFTVPDEPASIAFPTVPVASPTMTQTADGQSVPLGVWSVDQGAIAYVLTSLPYPAGTTFSLEDGRDGSLSTVGATLGTSTPIELQGRPGLEFTGTIADQGLTAVTRLYDDGTHAYSVVVVGSGPLTPTDPAVAGFLDSFTFDEGAAQ